MKNQFPDQPRKSKYKSKRKVIDGKVFASQREAKVYLQLAALEKAKQISQLKLQVPFRITINNHYVCTYVADFTYLDYKGSYVVADAKGFRTPLYRLKKKLIKAVYNIDILEL